MRNTASMGNQQADQSVDEQTGNKKTFAAPAVREIADQRLQQAPLREKAAVIRPKANPEAPSLVASTGKTGMMMPTPKRAMNTESTTVMSMRLNIRKVFYQEIMCCGGTIGSRLGLPDLPPLLSLLPPAQGIASRSFRQQAIQLWPPVFVPAFPSLKSKKKDRIVIK